jgi:hypothetical protein
MSDLIASTLTMKLREGRPPSAARASSNFPASSAAINLTSSSASSRRRSVTAISTWVSIRASAALSEGVLCRR